jgi:ribosomal protein S18 acetylase RimI-like enzyme
MNIQIRKAEASDQLSITNLNSVSSDAALIAYSEKKQGLFSSNEYFNAGGFFWVAEDTDVQKIVGMVGVKKVGDSIAKVKGLRVQPDYREKGIAKSLMEVLEKYCRENHYKEITLGVNAKAIPAIKLYESLDYLEDKRKEINSSVTAIYYKKLL